MLDRGGVQAAPALRWRRSRFKVEVRMLRGVGAALLAGLGFLAACSGKMLDDEDDTSTAGKSTKPAKPTPSPAARCETYASTWCVKAFGCYVQVGRLDEGSRQYNVDQCTSLIVDKFPCSAASSVGDDYDKCLSQIKAMACSRWDVPQTQFGTVRPPATCDEVIGFE